MSIRDRAWIVGYDIAAKYYPGDIRACRIFADAYANGYNNGRKNKKVKRNSVTFIEESTYEFGHE